MIRRVSDVLKQALSPVLRDIRTSGLAEPEIRDGDWMQDPLVASAWLCSADGSVIGIRVMLAASGADRITEAAGQVQDWLIDELRGTSATNWPPCPNHPESHPLMPSTRERVLSGCAQPTGRHSRRWVHCLSPHSADRA